MTMSWSSKKFIKCINNKIVKNIIKNDRDLYK